MKIALVVSGGVHPSGVDRVVPCLLWLIERLALQGDEVHVFCLHGTASEPWPMLGATIRNAGGSGRLLHLFRQILAEHRRSPFQVVHTMWSVRANLVAIAAAKLLGLPALLYCGSEELAALPDIPGFGRHLSVRGRLSFHLAVAGARRVAAQSDYIVELARRRGVRAERLALGVALDRWPPLAPRRRAARAPARLLHVAHITPVKDHEMLLATMARLKGMGVAFELDIIGTDIAGDGAVAHRAAELGLEREVRLHGFVRHHAIRPFFERADLCLLTSRYEAGPLCVMEAAIAGVPAVGTNVGHLSEWAPLAARVVEPRDSDGLASIVAGLLADEDERLALAEQAQARALAENADITTRRLREVYAEMSGAGS